MKRLKALLVLFLLLFPLSFIHSRERLLKNGYTLPAATEENIKKLIEQTRRNMVYVEGGSFMMGDAGRIENGKLRYWTYWRDTKPAHKVTLDSYYISKYELTYWEYDLYTDAVGIEPIDMKASHHKTRCGNYAVSVTWQRAVEYCEWLSKISGEPYCLPTEAQWEYAARNRGKNIYYATDNGRIDPGRNFVHKYRGMGGAFEKKIFSTRHISTQSSWSA